MRPSLVCVALTLTALMLPVSIAGSNAALALLTAALLLRFRDDGKRMAAAWTSEPLLIALGAYAAVGLLCASLSAAPAESLRDASKDLHRLFSTGLFVAAITLEPEAPLRPALGLSLGAMATYGIAQTACGGTPHGMLVRAHGFVHPVVYGEQMALAALGGACVLLRPTTNASRQAAGFFTALVAVALIVSQTRMAFLAATVGFAVVVLLEPRARRWAIPISLAVVVVTTAWEFAPTGGRTMRAILTAYDPGNPQQARWALWDVAWRIFLDHRAFGAGPGGYHRVFALYHRNPVEGAMDWGSAHNLYLHQLAERGLLGGLALFFLCGTLLVRALRAARQDADTRALWAVGSVSAFLAMSLTETAFQNEQFSTLLLLIWVWGTISLRPRREFL